MVYSRIGRLEEKRERNKLIIAIAGSVGVIVFLMIFGLNILTWFSLGVDRLRGGTPTQSQTSQRIILPPILDPIPIATSSSLIKITGSAPLETQVILYVNEAEIKKVSVSKDQTFSFASIRLTEGQNTISAKASDEKGNTSDLSNVLTILMKKTPPSLEVASPNDNEIISGDNNMVIISGKTENDGTVTINDRLAVTRSDGSFSYSYPLNTGENKLRIVATDMAGNQTVVEKTVKYEK